MGIDSKVSCVLTSLLCNKYFLKIKVKFCVGTLFVFNILHLTSYFIVKIFFFETTRIYNNRCILELLMSLACFYKNLWEFCLSLPQGRLKSKLNFLNLENSQTFASYSYTAVLFFCL